MPPNWHCYAFATLGGWYHRSTHRQPAVVVAVQPLDDVGQWSVVLRARDDSVAVPIQHLEGTHGQRTRGLMPDASEFNDVEVAVAVAIVGRVAVIADLVDLCLAELAVTVGVDGFEYFHRHESELSHGEETHDAKTAFRVARACECYTADSRGDAYANHRLRFRSHGYAPASNLYE